jgi:hypothetical protein
VRLLWGGVDDQDLDATQPLLQPRQLAGIARLQELADQIGGAGKEHAAFLFRGFDAEDASSELSTSCR